MRKQSEWSSENSEKLEIKRKYQRKRGRERNWSKRNQGIQWERWKRMSTVAAEQRTWAGLEKVIILKNLGLP